MAEGLGSPGAKRRQDDTLVGGWGYKEEGAGPGLHCKLPRRGRKRDFPPALEELAPQFRIPAREVAWTRQL